MKKILVCAFLLLLGGQARGTPIINVGAHVLQPNQANQPIAINVTGGDLVQALNLVAEVADGGPAAGGTIVGPTITADILTGTIFAANNTGQFDPGSAPQVAVRTTTTASGTVAANGLLATLFIDTSGFSGGTFALRLTDKPNPSPQFDTDFGGIQATIVNGSFTVVPEPSAFLLAGCGVAALLSYGNQRRRRSRASAG